MRGKKVHPVKVTKLFQMYEEGLSVGDIAKRLGMSRYTVRTVLKSKTGEQEKVYATRKKDEIKGSFIEDLED